jgi:hypothetical protein
MLFPNEPAEEVQVFGMMPGNVRGPQIFRTRVRRTVAGHQPAPGAGFPLMHIVVTREERDLEMCAVPRTRLFSTESGSFL